MRITAIALGVFASAAVAGGQSVTVTFDPPILPGGGYQIHAPYIQEGVSFSVTNHPYFAIYDGGLVGRPDNGTAYLADPIAMRFNFVNDALFSFNRLDVAEYSDVFASPQFVQLFGHKADNTVVEFDFYTDGIFDGTGPLPDFQTIVLPDSFTDLRWVEFGLNNNTGAIAIDNVNLSVVPEPSLLAFVALGAASLTLVCAERRHAGGGRC